MFIIYTIAGLLLAVWLTNRIAAIVINAGFPPLGRFMTIQGARLHVLDLPAPPGAGAGDPTIVLMHGASGNLRDPLGAIGRRLNERYRVVLVDRPGQGHSVKRYRHQSDPRIQANMIADVLDELKVSGAVIVGHSWGGAVTAAFGYQHAERALALVFVAPATHPWPGGIDWHYRIGSTPVVGRVFAELLAFPIGLPLVPCALRSIFSPQPTPPDYRRTVGAAMVLRPASFVANCQDIADLYANVMAMQVRYPEIALPVEIVTGDRDAIVWPAIHSYGLARDIPGASLTVLENVGHMPQWSDTDAVLAAIERAVMRSSRQPGLAAAE